MEIKQLSKQHGCKSSLFCHLWQLVLPLGFDVKDLIPQGLTGSPNYFGLLNNLLTLIIRKRLREIGEMACVTSAWSSRGQTLNNSKCLTAFIWTSFSHRFLSYFLQKRYLLVGASSLLWVHGWVSQSVRDVCISHQSHWIYYKQPIKFLFVKVNGLWEDLIAIQFRTAIFILL